MIRILEYKDWVIFSLLGVGFLYVFLFRVLLRDIGLVEYLKLSIEMANNRFQSWVITSLGFIIVLALALVPYLSVTPALFSEYFSIAGYEPSRFGSVLVVVLALWAYRAFFTYFLLASLGDVDRWDRFYFVSTKFFLVYTIVLAAMVVLQYYIPIDRGQMLYVYFVLFGVGFIFKNLIYYYHKQPTLPEEWYYKILYICTLQILPALVVLKFLFL